MSQFIRIETVTRLWDESPLYGEVVLNMDHIISVHAHSEEVNWTVFTLTTGDRVSVPWTLGAVAGRLCESAS